MYAGSANGGAMMCRLSERYAPCALALAFACLACSSPPKAPSSRIGAPRQTLSPAMTPTSLTIQGSACEKYKMDLTAVLEADFPCEVIDLN
jgi:hypothetical protein